MFVCRSSGTFAVEKVVPQANGEASKVKVKVRVNIHGVFTVSSAVLVEKLDNTEDETIEDEEEEKKAESPTKEPESPAKVDEPMDVENGPANEKDAKVEETTQNNDAKSDEPVSSGHFIYFYLF